MSKTVLVSVVMPTYNREDLLPFAIESVISQTFENFELIVVDDGSVDNTKQLVASYAERDPRIRYIYQKNQGQSSARNNGIEHSSGKYIAFIDSDNIWLSNRLEMGVSLLEEKPDIGLCFADLIYIDIDNKEIHRNNMSRYGGMVFDKLIVDNFVSMNTVLVRKSILPSARPFNERNRLDEDYELWLDLSVSNKFSYIRQFLAKYRIEGERISNNFMLRLDANEATVWKILDKYSLDRSNSEIRKGLGAHYLRRASVIGQHGSFFLAAKNILIAIRFMRFSLRPFLALARLTLKKLRLV